MSTSITAAVKKKFETLDNALFPSGVRPATYFGEAPQTDDTGAQVRLPYCVFSELGRQSTPLDFEGNRLLIVQLATEVYYHALGDVDAAVDAIRWNGGGVRDGLGFDYGTLPNLASPRSVHQMVPTAEPRALAPQTDREGKRVHSARLEHRLTVLESA